MKPLSSRFLLWAGLFLAFLVGTSVFQSNALHTVDSRFFEAFDRFSQGLVVGNIVAHDAGIADPIWNLGFVTVNGDQERSENIWATYQQTVKNDALKSVVQKPYISQYGVQGVAFLALHRIFSITDFVVLQLFNSVLFSLVITALAFLFSRIYDWRFGVVFFLVCIGSPWLVAFARNLYWVPFTWFLPAVFAALAYRCKSNLRRALCLFGVAAAVFLKSLAGYEYLTNITLFACSVFVIGPFFREQEPRHWFNFKLGCQAFIACLLGFACALLIHAGMRGDTIAQGLANILEQDVKRRTYGDPINFDPILRESLTASVFDVISMYWNNWTTPVLTGVAAKYLNIASAFVLLGLLYSLVKQRAIGLKVLAVLAVYFLASISWFVAAKAHSWVHTQLNYVMWYFGFIQALVYGVVSIALLFAQDFLAWRKTLDPGGRRLLVGGMAAALIVLLGVTGGQRIQRFDSKIDTRLAGAVETVELGSGFKVVFLQDSHPILMKTECSDFNRSARVMLRALPDAPGASVRDMDFSWREHAITAPRFSKHSCMAYLPRMDFRIKSLVIGQYEPTDQRRPKVLWQGHANLFASRYLQGMSAMDYTDGNWNKGILRTAPAFLLPNDFVNRQSLAFGDVLDMGSAGERTISGIGYSTDYITIYVDGPALDPQQSGFPNKFVLIPK